MPTVPLEFRDFDSLRTCMRPPPSSGMREAQCASNAQHACLKAVARMLHTFGRCAAIGFYASLAGAAMAPALNSKASSDPSAVEKLLVRLVPRPSERCLSVGDIVAHQSPLIHAAQAEQQQVCSHGATVVVVQHSSPLAYSSGLAACIQGSLRHTTLLSTVISQCQQASCKALALAVTLAKCFACPGLAFRCRALEHTPEGNHMVHFISVP